MVFFLILIFTLKETQNIYNLNGFAEQLLGFNTDKESIEKMKINVENYPKCEFFYIPLLKAKDEETFKKFLKEVGYEPILLIYLLKDYEIYQEILEKNKLNKMELLKRFLWSLKISKREKNCPFEINFEIPEILGYDDEISKECYSFFLIYKVNDFQDFIPFSSCEPISKEYFQKEAGDLLKKYKIPLINRKIIDTTPKKIIKELK